MACANSSVVPLFVTHLHGLRVPCLLKCAHHPGRIAIIAGFANITVAEMVVVSSGQLQCSHSGVSAVLSVPCLHFVLTALELSRAVDDL